MTLDFIKDSVLVELTTLPVSEWNLESGSIKEDDQYVLFKLGNDLLDVNFDLEAEGQEFLDKGDYYTPSYSSTEINHLVIYIKEIYLNGDIIEVSEDFEKVLNKKIVDTIH